MDTQNPQITHVYPDQEETMHVLEGLECWCDPQLIYESGTIIVVHQKGKQN